MQIYKYTKFLLPVCLVFIFGCSSTRRLKEGEHLLTRNFIIEKSNKVDKADLLAYIKQKPNRRLLGVYAFHLRVYNIFSEEKVKRKREKKDKKIAAKNIRRQSKNKKPKRTDRLTFPEWVREIGEAPVILDSILAMKSSKQLSLYLASKGYFNNTVSDSIKYRRKTAVVYYKIEAGRPYTIMDIRYSIDDKYLESYILGDTASSLLKKGNNYDVDVLQRERDRITKRLLNLGFYDFSKEYISYEVDSALGTYQLNITLGINNFLKPVPEFPDSAIESFHQQYRLSNVYVNIESMPKLSDAVPNDTLFFDGVHLIYKGELKYRPGVLTSAIFLRKGELYQLGNAEKSYQRLSNLRAFKLVSIRFEKTPGRADSLDAHITLSPIAKQAFSIEAQGTNTSANRGIAISAIYQNRNLFKGLEILEIRMRGGLEAQKPVNKEVKQFVFNTIEFGPEAKLDIPRFLLPFKVKVSPNSDPRTNFTSYLNYQQRPDYTRYAANISYGYTWRETPQKRHTINPIEVTFIKIDKGAGFEDFLKRTNDYLILNSYTDHLVTATRYTFQYNDQDLKRLSNFTYFKVNAEFSGNVLRGIYNLAEAPKDTGGSYRVSNIIFSQYLRLDIDYRHYTVYSGHRMLVFRTYAGVGKPLHNLRVLPFEKSFYAGGSSDIRAWEARTLGPGSFQSISKNNYDRIGDGLIEFNLEYRFKVTKMFNGAFFADAGNIWLRKKDLLRPNGEFRLDSFYKEMALGIGTGVRADFSFCILRVDLGLKVYDPAFGEDGRWVIPHAFDKQWKNNFDAFYGEKYSFLNLNFGIGYPF